jgi:hypothetical protein
MAKDLIEYYRTVSGLPFGLSLNDYMYKYFETASGLPAGLALDDYQRAFYEAQTGFKDIDTGERAYYAAQLLIPNTKLSVDDLRQMFLDTQ